MKRKFKKLPSNKRLNELLRYNPKTGELRWRVNRRGATKAGDIAGYLNPVSGYYIVTIDGVRYRAHRICYKMATGRDVGVFEIDHINGVKADNRLLNLRMADRVTQCRNRPQQANNSTGHNGIVFCKKRKKYRARIKINRKYIELGRFEELEDAVAARAAADVEYGFHVNHGRVV